MEYDVTPYERCPDLTGLSFGRLTVIKRVANDKDGEAQWLCECSCGSGKSVVARSHSLKSGNTTSCGCYRLERVSQSRTKHGDSNSRLYKIWSDMKQRCQNENATGYKNWGARGVAVCPEWANPESGFANFRKWAIENGYADNLTIDRKDTNGNYCPENCRWATAKEQANNKRNNRLIEYNGKTQTLNAWAAELGVPRSRLSVRLMRGWSVERAFTEPKVKPHIERWRKNDRV